MYLNVRYDLQNKQSLLPLTAFLLLHLQSALQPLVGFLACSTVVEPSQQEGFYSVVASSTSNSQLRGPVIRTFQLSPQGTASKRREGTRVTEGGTMGEKWPRILPKVATSTSLLGSFTCRILRHGTDGFTSPPKEGPLRIFSAEKSDGFGQVWTRELGYQRPARYLQTTEAALCHRLLCFLFVSVCWPIGGTVIFHIFDIISVKSRKSASIHTATSVHPVRLSVHMWQFDNLWKDF